MLACLLACLIAARGIAAACKNRLLLDNKVTNKEKETIPHLESTLEPIDQRRLEVIMTGAIRTQVRLNAAGIKNPQGEDFSRICPHCALNQEETAHHILWECTLSADIRAQTNISLDQASLASPARAGIPTEWDEWPGPLRAFGIIGLDLDIVQSVKNLPIARTYGPRPLIPVSYTHFRAHETGRNLVCRLLLENKKNKSLCLSLHLSLIPLS